MVTPQRKVRGWMVETGRTYATLAKELGISSAYLSNVVLGQRGCSLRLAVRFHEVSGLPVQVIAGLRKKKAKKGAAAVRA